MNDLNSRSGISATFFDAARFWEPRRLLYNAILTVVALVWLIADWSHYRPALSFSFLGVMIVLALLANVCYCAAYLAEMAIQQFSRVELWRRLRWGTWVVGTLFAVLLESYWINDEIYPGVGQPAPDPLRDMSAQWTPHLASNVNFPASFAVFGFLAAVAGLVLIVAAALIFWFARKPQLARRTLFVLAAVAAVYFALLFGCSAASRDVTLARGQEKYFCEIDCHLAYSVIDVAAQPSGRYQITLRTRFDESTISPSRPKDAPLTPSPREVFLLDAAGHAYAPLSTSGTPLDTPLKPGDSYTTQLVFTLPDAATGLRLLLRTVSGWPDHLVIGDENSWLHKKTYFAL